MSTIASPLKYQGNKLQLMPCILELLPKRTSGLIDVFGGSGTVSANVSASMDIPCIYNEVDSVIHGIMTMLAYMPKKAFEMEVWRIIKEFRLADSTCSDGYYKMVTQANATPETPNLLLLWMISRHAHSNLLRMNRKGEVNIQFGNRAIGHRLGEVFKEVDDFRTAMRKVKLLNMDYVALLRHIAPRLGKTDVLYFDPPYFASGQFVYRCTWKAEQERKLYKNLTHLDRMGFKFMLSNFVRHGPHLNMFLVKWMRNFNVHEIDSSYCLSNAYEDKSNTREVIVTNY